MCDKLAVIPRSLERIALLFALTLGATPTLSGCESDGNSAASVEGTEEPLTSVTDKERTAAQATDISTFTFDQLTPTGTKLMRAAHWWMDAQDESPRYPRPRMCASNVSKVLFLSGIYRYDQEGVRRLIADVDTGGGEVFAMPQSKAAFIAKLNTIHGGHIPAGTLVAGMSVRSSNPGDQHVGLVGHVDTDGTVWTYHNNWYRPENEGGVRKPFMISNDNIRRGYLRQWMATPWIRISRDAKGTIVDVTSLLPAIDDMDPFNPTYRVTLAIPDEIAREIR